MIKVGITERGDAGIDFSWTDKLLSVNIIISKSLNDNLIKNLINNKDRIIFHSTITGFGNTVLEPNVPTKEQNYNQILKLVNKGFPSNQIVLRTDPIIPTDGGLRIFESVLKLFYSTDIKRVRYSFMDLYPHVKKRLIDANLPLPYNKFTAPKQMINNALELIYKYEDRYEFESCAEYTKHQLGCISQKDFDILGINEQAEPVGFQRKGCMCISGKTELLSNKHRCYNGCLYCYWK